MVGQSTTETNRLTFTQKWQFRDIQVTYKAYVWTVGGSRSAKKKPTCALRTVNTTTEKVPAGIRTRLFTLWELIITLTNVVVQKPFILNVAFYHFNILISLLLSYLKVPHAHNTKVNVTAMLWSILLTTIFWAIILLPFYLFSFNQWKPLAWLL